VSDTSSRIEEFIRDQILFRRRSVSLAEDTPLTSGLIDSLGLAGLVTFLEAEFDVEIGHQDMTPANFRTVRDIAALVERKAGTAA
jgi:acyl carrier protein